VWCGVVRCSVCVGEEGVVGCMSEGWCVNKLACVCVRVCVFVCVWNIRSIVRTSLIVGMG
jgi:hypothetical protein